jgi:biopolymer transport protein ExbD
LRVVVINENKEDHLVSRLANRHANEDEAQIDLTPMLDVVFIMLIFFIVTASFIKESGIALSRPEANQQSQATDNKNILFKVTANNQIWLDDRRIDIRSVRANVERLHAENPQAAVIIQAHETVKNKTLIAIADQAREAQVYDISAVVVDH